jgi:hypothetical protein
MALFLLNGSLLGGAGFFEVHAHDPHIAIRDELRGGKMKPRFLAWLVISDSRDHLHMEMCSMGYHPLEIFFRIGMQLLGPFNSWYMVVYPCLPPSRLQRVWMHYYYNLKKIMCMHVQK